jgi:hypothetical protein
MGSSVRALRSLVAPLLLAAGALACATPPSARVDAGWGTVRAEDEAVALDAAHRAHETRSLLARAVPGVTDADIEIWVQEQLWAGPFYTPSREFVDGFTLRMLWRAGARIHVSTDNYEDTLPHELVHAMLGPSWDVLPAALEEGLCEVVAVEIGANREKRLVRLRDAAQWTAWTYQIDYTLPGPGKIESCGTSYWGSLSANAGRRSELTLDEILSIRPTGVWKDYDRAEVTHIYGAGYVIADRIYQRGGFARLHALCVRAIDEGHDRVPAAWILEAAEVESDTQFLADCVIDLERERLAHVLDSPFFRDHLRTIRSRALNLALTPEEFIDNFDPVITIDGGRAIPLARMPGFVTWAEANWNGL